MIESQAGIKFKIIGAPQPEDVIRASARGIMRKLDDVSDSVLDLFSDASKQITERFNGDKDKALQACLAYLSGHYKTTLVNRSLLSGQEKQTTLEMAFDPPGRGESAIDLAWRFIQGSIPQKQQDAIKGMRPKKDGSGVVFDVWEDKAER
jgi:ATP-dependent RNA helicase DDX21